MFLVDFQCWVAEVMEEWLRIGYGPGRANWYSFALEALSNTTPNEKLFHSSASMKWSSKKDFQYLKQVSLQVACNATAKHYGPFYVFFFSFLLICLNPYFFLFCFFVFGFGFFFFFGGNWLRCSDGAQWGGRHERNRSIERPASQIIFHGDWSPSKSTARFRWPPIIWPGVAVEFQLIVCIVTSESRGQVLDGSGSLARTGVIQQRLLFGKRRNITDDDAHFTSSGVPVSFGFQ